MINLLPPEEKKELWAKRKKKLILILWNVFLIPLICLILVLLSVNFYILGQLVFQKNSLEQAELSSRASDLISFKDTIEKYNSAIAQVSSFYSQKLYFNDVLKIISAIEKPAGLRLAALSFNKETSKEGLNKIKAVASGVSDTRENLLVFKKNIEANKEIENPYFTPQSWISQKDVNFEITFEISKNEK